MSLNTDRELNQDAFDCDNCGKDCDDINSPDGHLFLCNQCFQTYKEAKMNAKQGR